MEVRPKKNKPFVCDECGKKIDTEGDYGKLISVTFVDGRKFRNKFCSLDCFEKWRLLHKKPNGTKEPLEVEVKKMTEVEKESYKEEEEPEDKDEILNGKKHKGVSYKGESKAKYENKKDKIIDVNKVRKEVECLNLTSEKGRDMVKYPGRYDRPGSLQKFPKYAPKETIKKFMDYFNIFRITHDKDKYK